MTPNNLIHNCKRLIGCTLLLLLSVHSLAQPSRIMSVGHSLLGHPHMPAAINALAADAGFTITANKTQNNPGASLQFNFTDSSSSHVDDYKVELRNNTFDVFIITEAMPLQSNVTYREGYKYANDFYNVAIANNPATQFYIWQTWDCRANLNTGNCNDSRAINGLVGQITLDLSTWESLADSVSTNNNNANILVIPGGQALIALDTAITSGQVDGISNISEIFDDDIHLNANGWYFTALVQYAAIFKSSPVGLTSTVPTYSNTLTPAAAAAMQQIAWNTVCNYPRSGVSCTGSPLPPNGKIPPNSPRNLSITTISTSK